MKKRRNFNDENFEDNIDLTPMINVSLILVIVFMAVTPLAVMTGIKAISSKSSGVSLGRSSKEDVVKINLLKNGQIQINGFDIEKKYLIPYLRDAILMSPSQEVVIMADYENLVKDVVYLMDISKQHGAAKVSIAE
ncbi:MAG: biopolymer transporter ExbD [Elusimicrobiota bacterium]|jgi:biopolymer transport protein ExbD|nr:biopolymer transporter ExbD [Elusimicrobiota bacterium]